MTTFYPPPGFRAPSGNTSLAPNKQRIPERPKGSLPTYSRPQLYRQSFPHAVRPNRAPKSTPRSREVEAMLAVKYRGVDERIADFWRVHEGGKEVLKEAQDANRRVQEKAQDNIIFFQNMVERGRHAEQRIKETRQDTIKNSRELEIRQEVNRADRTQKEIRKGLHDYDQMASEFKRDRKAKEQHLHQSLTAYRDLRREGRRAGLR
ncbi:hypothetical protein EVG20_g11194 [Dentipellis fragilis]|uniref:Uncharacterized protein n=1 Tax=Dentipellis fragilis TaxID=205917 RepID=A0A4Y9XL87_9AGAM|nr:hypothetical protein EVG20_g11194 [Dentipellis fragilis]